MTPALEARSLTKRFADRVALDQLDLRVMPGEIYCLLGANGAGKTTTIHLFLNFIEPSGGQALVQGLDVLREPQASKRRLAYIPEQMMLYGTSSGLGNLEYFCELGGVHKQRDELRGVLRSVGLEDSVIDRKVSTYSKGMRQRVGIALALAREADVLLLDEPTSGLDPKASNEFSELLASLRGRGAAVLMATHDLFRAKETGTRIGIMRGGRLVQTLQPESLGHAELERLYLEHMKD